MQTEPCEFCYHRPTLRRGEQNQQPYRGLFQALVGRVAALSPDVPVYQRDLDRWLRELWEEQPDAREAFALNTTLYGRLTPSESI